MTPIELARDALPQQASTNWEVAAAVVRAADLAAELRSRGERLSESAYVHERAEGAGYMAAAAQLVAALEGGEQ